MLKGPKQDVLSSKNAQLNQQMSDSLCNQQPNQQMIAPQLKNNEMSNFMENQEQPEVSKIEQARKIYFDEKTEMTQVFYDLISLVNKHYKFLEHQNLQEQLYNTETILPQKLQGFSKKKSSKHMKTLLENNYQNGKNMIGKQGQKWRQNQQQISGRRQNNLNYNNSCASNPNQAIKKQSNNPQASADCSVASNYIPSLINSRAQNNSSKSNVQNISVNINRANVSNSGSNCCSLPNDFALKKRNILKNYSSIMNYKIHCQQEGTEKCWTSENKSNFKNKGIKNNEQSFSYEYSAANSQRNEEEKSREKEAHRQKQKKQRYKDRHRQLQNSRQVEVQRYNRIFTRERMSHIKIQGDQKRKKLMICPQFLLRQIPNGDIQVSNNLWQFSIQSNQNKTILRQQICNQNNMDESSDKISSHLLNNNLNRIIDNLVDSVGLINQQDSKENKNQVKHSEQGQRISNTENVDNCESNNNNISSNGQ